MMTQEEIITSLDSDPKDKWSAGHWLEQIAKQLNITNQLLAKSISNHSDPTSEATAEIPGIKPRQSKWGYTSTGKKRKTPKSTITFFAAEYLQNYPPRLDRWWKGSRPPVGTPYHSIQAHTMEEAQEKLITRLTEARKNDPNAMPPKIRTPKEENAENKDQRQGFS